MRARLSIPFLFSLLPAALLLAVAHRAESIPRYAARYGQKCLLCHTSPTGGGMRDLYASQFLIPEEIAARSYGKGRGGPPNPEIGENITIGADLRTLATYSTEQKTENNFFQMQGDLYLQFRFDNRFSAYFDRGTTGSYELYGTGFVLPAHGYFKIGRFVPAYGWRFADHTLFTRQDLGHFDPPRHTDVGLEIGLFPRDFSINLSLLNGAPGLTRDTDGVRMYTVRVEKRWRFGAANLAAGASWLGEDEEEVLPWAAGPFGYLSWGAYTWLGEWDWTRGGEGGATAFITSHELTRRIVRGVDLRATYSFYDPDIDAQSGARSKIGIGFDSLPFPFLGVTAMIDYHAYDDGATVTGSDFTQGNVQFHFLY